MKRLSSAVLAAALSLSVVAAPVVAQEYTVAPLATDFLYFTNYGSRETTPAGAYDYGHVTIEGACDMTGTSTLTLEADGTIPASSYPYRPYTGDWTETATVVLGPHQIDSQGYGILQSAPVISVDVVFEISGPQGHIEGTKTFTGGNLGYPNANGTCSNRPNLFDPNETDFLITADAGLAYDVTFTTPNGCAREVGNLGWSLGRSVSALEGDGRGFSNQFLGHAVYGGSQTPIVCPDPPAPPDNDNDGIPDGIDADGGAGTSPAGSFSDDTGDGAVTTGAVTDSAGLGVTITDAADPDGVTIGVAAGTGLVTLSVCGGSTIRVNAGSEVTLTCGSVTLAVASGSASIILGGGLTVVDIPTGGEATVDGTEAAGYTVANQGATDVSVTVDGVTSTLAAGATPSPLRAWDFVGFDHPVDNGAVLNRVKAGQAVPIKWRLLSATGAPITNLATASITVAGFDCGSASTVDQLEETAAGASGLTNLGNGYYQMNWKSPRTYGGSCKTMRLNVEDGVTHDASFQFTR